MEIVSRNWQSARGHCSRSTLADLSTNLSGSDGISRGAGPRAAKVITYLDGGMKAPNRRNADLCCRSLCEGGGEEVCSLLSLPITIGKRKPPQFPTSPPSISCSQIWWLSSRLLVFRYCKFDLLHLGQGFSISSKVLRYSSPSRIVRRGVFLPEGKKCPYSSNVQSGTYIDAFENMSGKKARGQVPVHGLVLTPTVTSSNVFF